MDSFFAVCCVLATGIFMGSTATAWIGLQLEKKQNAKLEKEKHAMSVAVDVLMDERGARGLRQIYQNILEATNDK